MLQISTPILRDRHRMFILHFFVFSRWNFRYLNTHISLKIQKNKLWREGGGKLQTIRRGALNMCANFQGLSKIWGEHWTLKQFGVVFMNQPVAQQEKSSTSYISLKYHRGRMSIDSITSKYLGSSITTSY